LDCKQLGERTANILKYLFPVPKPDTKRIVTFANTSDYISFRLVAFVWFCAFGLLCNCVFEFFIFFFLGVCFLLIWNIVSAAYRHHIYEKQGGPKSVELKEIGPRFELRLYQVCVAIMITIDFFCYVFHDGGLKQITTFT
jgi:U3 small nucleolar ribonucleoprotein protein IMP4